MNIYLDDERTPPHGWLGVTTAKECIAFLKLCREKKQKINILSLDHDLGFIDPDSEETGYDVLCWLEENLDAMPAKVYLHTVNPVGRRRMQLVLDAIERRIN